MKDIDNLEYLNVSNNMITLIENFPENGIPEFVMENTPSIEFRGNIPDAQSDKRKRKTKKMNDFKKALSSYFNLKSKYEKKDKELKKQAFKKSDSRKKGKIAAQNIQPQCIKCKRKVGTIFRKHQIVILLFVEIQKVHVIYKLKYLLVTMSIMKKNSIFIMKLKKILNQK